MGVASVQVDKVVNVITHAVEGLLRFAEPQHARRVRDFALMEIQKQHHFCRIVRSLTEEHGVDQDPRAKKSCVGYCCYYCRHAEACKDGETILLFIPRHELRETVTEECKCILNIDGSSIEAPTQAP